ncbi:hypothetical protein [Parasitella parasitica]|uniref:BHLH domain-containing protein n=1 Tax=Parasitella parasitica TaxID=35722 RepID=A0A0B7NCV6_9FUNG|nr:hypothetical protein [Parasitella parasitica]
MSSIQQAHYNQSFGMVDPVFYSQQSQNQPQQQRYQVQQYMTLQQLELERIRQVQQQAAYQQQRALEMMYYQQEMQQNPQSQLDQLLLANKDMNEFMTPHMGHYSPTSSASPPSHPMSHFANQQDGTNSSTGGDKAQKRAEHNAIERARRECLNTKFQQLAHSLPNLQNDRRPSKGTIIERTLEYVKQTVQKEQRFQSEIDQLRQANENLIYKMTSDHFGDSAIEEVDEDEDYDETNTPDCDDNFSSRSSVTSVSSHHMYSFTDQQQPNTFEKTGDASFMNGRSPALLL